jgi:hypothetical protein
MKSIAVFRSDAFDHSWPQNGSDPNAVPLGKDLAAYLKTRLAERNIPVRDPFQGTDGWVIDGVIEEVSFSWYIHWVPIGTPPADHWAIQPQIRRGILKSLPGFPKASEELEPIFNLLTDILSRDTRISHLTWMDGSEFAAVY